MRDDLYLVCFCNSAVTGVVFVPRRIRASVFSLSLLEMNEWVLLIAWFAIPAAEFYGKRGAVSQCGVGKRPG